MHNGRSMAVAILRGDGSIGLYRERLSSLSGRFPVFQKPLLRGAVAFFEAMIFGIRALNISTAYLMEEKGKAAKNRHSRVTVLARIILGVAFFFLLPTYLAGFLPQTLPPVLLNLLEGTIRVTIFFGYVYLSTRRRNTQRLIQFHGAEHKAIFCYEAGGPLDPVSARLYPTRHPRCGTSLILIVMAISIFIFSLFAWPDLRVRLLIRLALLPGIAGLSYEIIRLTIHGRIPLINVLAAPGLWLQKMTTGEPDEKQLNVALCALKAVLDQRDNNRSRFDIILSKQQEQAYSGKA